jgi:HSP20 family protein
MLPIRIYNDPTMRLFDDIFNDMLSTSSTTARMPKHNVIENDNEFKIELSLAGIKKEDIDIDINKDVMIIKAERKEVTDVKYNRKQTYFGQYERMFVLPDGVDKENISASLVDGMLNVIVPKLACDTKLSKKKIEIT